MLGANEVLVIGSQALHASIDGELPEEARRSVEVDIAVFDDHDGSKADLIDGSIGEASMFHETFGYYAHGVSESTAALPRGWRDRLIHFETPATHGVAALCLEPHDLWIAKAIANRPRDVDFCRALLERRIVGRGVLASRLLEVQGLDPRVASVVQRRIEEEE